MLEREIEKKVCDYAKEKGFLVYKFSSPNHVGVPDRLFVAPHQQAFWIEFKREGGKPTAMQEREMRRLRHCGFDVYLVDSVEHGMMVIDKHKEMSDFSVQMFVMVQQSIAKQEQSEATKH
jgi:hypothetical protein